MQKWIFRIIIYLIGMFLLAMGLTLNTKTGLGVSPIMSVPFSLSQVLGWKFSNMVFIYFIIMVAAQYCIKGKNRSWLDLLQLALSLVFTLIMNWIDNWLKFKQTDIFSQILLLILAIVLTGVGAATTVNMRMIANPADAIVLSISERTGKKMGFVKNIFDIACVATSCVTGLIIAGKPIGIGLGTLVAALGIGRVITATNFILKDRILFLAGLGPAQADMANPDQTVSN